MTILAAGCAARPGPEVLAPTTATAEGARIVTVYVATTRARDIQQSNVFGSSRADGVNYAEFRISVPPGHKAGQIEWPRTTPDPATSFATVQQRVHDRETFLRRIAQRGDARKAPDAGVFVHGFNYNFQESLFRLAQMAADADIDGVPVLFAWPSEAEVTGYIADKDSATYSRDALVDLLATLTQQRGSGKITVFGHSMGGWLTMEAVRQLRLTGKSAVLARLDVILAAPDIDVDVFRAQMNVIGRLDPPVTVLVSRDDVALSFSGRIAGQRPRLGALDVDDPQVQELALRSDVQIVDISSFQASDGFNHDRFVNLAALYPRLASGEGGRPGHELRTAGAFVLNAVGATLSTPFSLAGQAFAGQ
jgi:esterase/lipase superfamily enzyme